MGKTKNAARFLAPIFKQNGWEWSKVGVPDEDDICETLKSLKHNAKEVKGFSATGRLLARYDYDSKKVEYFLEIPNE